MSDHPPSGCKAGKAHVEGDYGHLDESDSLVENNRPDAADVLEDAVLLVGDIVHVLSVATVRDARKTEGRPCQRQCLQPVSDAMPRRENSIGVERYKSEYHQCIVQAPAYSLTESSKAKTGQGYCDHEGHGYCIGSDESRSPRFEPIELRRRPSRGHGHSFPRVGSHHTDGLEEAFCNPIIFLIGSRLPNEC